MELQHTEVVVQPAGDGIRQQAEEGTALDGPIGVGVPVDGGLRGEPCPPAPDVEQGRQQHQGGQGRQHVMAQGAQDVASHPVAFPQPQIEEDTGQAEEGDVVQPGPFHRQSQTEEDTGGETPPAETEPGSEFAGGDTGGVQPVVHLLVIAYQGPGGGGDEEDLEDVQHAETGGHQEHAVGGGDDAGDEGHHR